MRVNKSGLMHETHMQDVEQVYLRCSQGALEWLYPTGAIIINLRPNTASPAARRLSVCIKPSRDSQGANIYLDRAGELRLLLREQDQALGRVHCFGIQEGALFIEAIPHRDISRRITAFQYELVNERLRPDQDSLSAPCQPCSDQELLLAACASDFVARGSILGMEEEVEQTSLTVTLSRLYRQKSQVFVSGGGRARRWTGRVRMPPQCGVRPGEGEYLFTGTVRFGEAWLGCAPHYKDFLKVYTDAVEQGSNPCHIETN
ncbi:meteorin-like protein isoform X3 [Paramormyrops kingsleyae]|uniref:meteorin-like protein isoform X3 n=1 Tax=Paramormyrops kingsleyae TaxID=1676925 RepID=UPI000CD657D9|nr:meteorin-like protein isoform X2 [Paramormyrops kingsleyae]